MTKGKSKYISTLPVTLHKLNDFHAVENQKISPTRNNFAKNIVSLHPQNRSVAQLVQSASVTLKRSSVRARSFLLHSQGGHLFQDVRFVGFEEIKPTIRLRNWHSRIFSVGTTTKQDFCIFADYIYTQQISNLETMI